MNAKICFKCKKEKPLSEFYKHKKMADRYLGKCKQCAKKDVSQRREENIDKVRAYDRNRGDLPYRVALRKEYQKTEAGKIATNRAKKKWAEQHPQERAAQCILYNAIRSGKIKKEPCEKCGSVIRIHGHHDDYTKPLDVRWLCPKCHSLHHKQSREERRPSGNQDMCF